MHDLVSQNELATVLLIDDDLVSREVTATLLTMSGYSVHTAADGAASLAMLGAEECRPDVILMDAQMPGLSGTELIAELRARCAARVYAISASPPPAAMATASDGFLLKPFDAETFRKLIAGSEAQGAGLRLESQKALDSQEPQDSQEPIVSVEILTHLRKLMPETAVRQIYAALVADLARRIEALGVAIAKGDAAEVRRIGHAIKGGCGMAGAMQAAHMGALLEAIPLGLKGNKLDNSAALLRDLRAATLSLERMLESELPA